MLNTVRAVARRAPVVGGLIDGGLGVVSDLGTAGWEMAHALDTKPDGKPHSARDAEYISKTLPGMKRFFDVYFRPNVQGLENIPETGPVLLVGNHSGGLYIADTFVFSLAFYDFFGADRCYYQLAHDLAATMPGIGGWGRRFGMVPASHDNAKEAFERNAAVLVYPGGDHETFRPSWRGDEIQFDGRDGFIHLALESGVPIVPVVSAGGQETALFLTRGRRIARWTKLDQATRIKVAPISIGPPFGLNLLDIPGRIPLPAKIDIRVLEPIDLTERYGADPDIDTVFDDVTGEMQEALTALSDERTLPLVG